jgi:hypothetical protein
MSALSISSASKMWEVFVLFAVPIGGGIPAGVVLAQSQGIGWLTMTLIYFCSDLLLAILFEPFMKLFIYGSEHIQFLAKLRASLKKTTEKTIAGYGAKPGPFLLITIAFGVDPMTGRAAAMAAGHNFISGWAIAIAGDMIFFGIIAASTILLNGILGDGTLTAVIILILMVVVPALVRKFKPQKKIAK